jgi:uncharacterized protein with PIN domain
MLPSRSTEIISTFGGKRANPFGVVSNQGSVVMTLGAWLAAHSKAVLDWTRKIARRYAMLEKRVSDLEAALADCPGRSCPSCGKREMRMKTATAVLGQGEDQRRDEIWKCQKCKFELQDRTRF